MLIRTECGQCGRESCYVLGAVPRHCENCRACWHGEDGDSKAPDCGEAIVEQLGGCSHCDDDGHFYGTSPVPSPCDYHWKFCPNCGEPLFPFDAQQFLEYFAAMTNQVVTTASKGKVPRLERSHPVYGMDTIERLKLLSFAREVQESLEDYKEPKNRMTHYAGCWKFHQPCLTEAAIGVIGSLIIAAGLETE